MTTRFPTCPPTGIAGPGPGEGPGGAPLDDYAGYDDFPPAGPAWEHGPAGPQEAARRAEPDPDEPWPPRARRDPFRIAAGGRLTGRVVAITAVAAAILGFGVVIVTGRVNQSLPSSALPGGTVAPGTAGPGTAGPGTPARGTPASGAAASATAPPVTQAQAQQVLATYTSTNNTANAQASQPQLATVETGSSLAIDAGIDRVKHASGSAPYPAYGPAHAAYYIPLEPPATRAGSPSRSATRSPAPRARSSTASTWSSPKPRPGPHGRTRSSPSSSRESRRHVSPSTRTATRPR